MTYRTGPLSHLPGLGLMIIVAMLTGPAMVFYSTNRNGEIHWPQFCAGVFGTIFWMAIIAEVSAYV